ncbi:MAG: P-loop NTPase, partial [Chloroflexi bacterium]|nr:P-loop NTPase [Chloroflexota bacterium]
EHQALAPESLSRVYSVFAAKGGVGKTTIAFNLAVAARQQGYKVALVDGSLQFADLRALLRVPDSAPSLLQLPTDRITETDLQEVMWRDPWASTSCWHRRGWRWPRWSPRATWRRPSHSCGASTTWSSSTRRRTSTTRCWPSSMPAMVSSRSSRTTPRHCATRASWPRRSRPSATPETAGTTSSIAPTRPVAWTRGRWPSSWAASPSSTW